MGRPTIITHPSGIDGLTIGELVVQNVARGFTHRDAAAGAGINPGSLTTWLYRGRTALARQDAGEDIPESEQVYAAFAAQVEDAKAQARAAKVKVIEDAAFKPQVVKRITRKLVDSGQRDRDGKPVLHEVERTERVEEHPPRWAAAAWLLERQYPADYGNRVQVHSTGDVDQESDAREFARELRAFLEGAAAAGQLGTGDGDVIEAEVVDDH